MSKSINERHEREGGFTLIELMVVVLIIGILMAIAIPTFLGARNTANARAAQSNLRNTLTAEQSYFTDNGQLYGGSAALQTYEPAITFNPAFPVTSATGVTVSVVVPAATPSAVELGAKGADGNFYYIYDSGGQVAYYTDKAKKTPGVFPLPAPTFATTLPLTSLNQWATAW